MTDVWARVRRFTTAVTWHRRLLAAGVAAAAVAFTIEALSPSPPPTSPVVVAADDLAGGRTLSAADLHEVQMPRDAVPDGALQGSVVGEVLAGPVRDGEVLTDRRVMGEALVAGWGADLVAAPIRIADTGSTAFLRPGDRIDLLATSIDGAGTTTTVAEAVPVLTITPGDDSALGEGSLVMVGATTGQAAALAQAAVTSRLSFTLGGS